ncbi:MAG: hypothetical protein KDA25_07035 [Phycisphaerales bacterium]|nr:hypothetical protein [Phycisphaerales bacterium]
MNLRWLVGNYADPQYDLTRDEQRRVTALAHEKHLPRAVLLGWTFAFTLFAIGCIWAGTPLLTPVLRLAGVPQASALGTIISGTIGTIIVIYAYRFVYARPARRAMRDLGYDICIGCGYRLDGLGSDIARCPECGSARPGVGTSGP